jgi:hypothetical protein
MATVKMLRPLFYAADRPSGFASLQKLAKASPRGMHTADMQKWLLQQDSYTLHRLIRKRFPRNPYTVTNIMDVWECDLLDVKILVNSTTSINIYCP